MSFNQMPFHQKFNNQKSIHQMSMTSNSKGSSHGHHPPQKVIEIQSLEFAYPSEPMCLRITHLEVYKGQKLFIYGPSGSGKSTLLEILSGILVPQTGSVSVLGEKLETMGTRQRDLFRSQKMGLIFQSLNLLPYLTVRENILLPLWLRGHNDEEEDQKLEALMAPLGLMDYLNQNITRLSMGQQQRVAVARALITNPSLLFADEPTSALDDDNRERFIQLMFSIAQQRDVTVLFVSHDRSLEKLFDQSLSLQELNKNKREENSL